MSTQETSTFRLDINALRAVAVLAVIAYHFDIPGFTGGFIGVDVFFVISGFLITSQIQQSLEAERFNFANFYVSRLRRIFPALAVMCFSILVFGWFYMLPDEYVSHTKNAFQALYFGSNHAFGKVAGDGGYFDAVKTSVSPFLHTWSLSIEGQFYLVFPIVWVLIFKYWRKWQTSIVFASFVIATAYFAFDATHHTNLSFYSLSVRAWEFLAGACLVILPQRAQYIFSRKAVANASSIVGISCILFSIYFIDPKVLWPSEWTLLPIVGAILVLLGQNTASTGWLFSNWLVQRMGDISYSLYLWHWPVIVFAKYFADALILEIDATKTSALLLVTVFLAFISWRFIEKPIREKREFWTNKKLVISFFSVMVAFWCIWRLVALSEGFSNRFAGQINHKDTVEMFKPPAYGTTCFDDQRKPVNKDASKACLLNTDKAAQKTEVLVWGDSHMHQYYPAVIKAAQELSVNGYFLSRGGCHATLPNEMPMQRHTIPQEMQFCNDFNTFVHDKFVANPQIKTIVLDRLWFDGEAVIQTIELVKALTKMGKKVVLIGAIPKPEFNPGEILLKRKSINLDLQINIAIERKKIAYLDGIDIFVTQHLAAEISQGKVIWVDAMSYFCDAHKCDIVKNGVSNFWDASHITEGKALEFTEAFKKALR